MSNDTFLTNEGDNVAQTPVEKREETVIPPTEEAKPLQDVKTFYCSTCQERYPEDKVQKMPLDYVREEDGSLSKAHTRFSVFCQKCQKFLSVIDQDAALALQELIKKHGK